MSTEREMKLLAELAAGARRVVEVGVYEGSSAIVLTRVLGAGTELHLVDPFVAGGSALRAGWRAHPLATRLAILRAMPRPGPTLVWHRARSQDVGRHWAEGMVDLVFIDGDHSAVACREDWDVWHPHVRPGGLVAFHDARLGQPGGGGHAGPTEVVDHLFRGAAEMDRGAAGWEISHEVDSVVVVRRGLGSP
jgi:predicted O-methyltransferase YrrM